MTEKRRFTLLFYCNALNQNVFTLSRTPCRMAWTCMLGNRRGGQRILK